MNGEIAPRSCFPMSFSIIFKAFAVEVPAVQDLGIYLVDKESGEFAEKHGWVDELTSGPSRGVPFFVENGREGAQSSLNGSSGLVVAALRVCNCADLANIPSGTVLHTVHIKG